MVYTKKPATCGDRSFGLPCGLEDGPRRNSLIQEL